MAEISQKDFSELKTLMSSMTKTLKNFDDRLNEVENNISDIGETVTVELPKVIAEQVGAAVDAAVEEPAPEAAPEATVEETVVAEEPSADANAPEAEVCPTCGNNPCTCADADANAEAPAEGQEFCGESFEEFSEKVTKTIEDLTAQANDIAERVNKMFVKVFSEGDDQINDVTEDEADVQKVEEGLKEDPKEFVTEEEPQITDEKKPEVKAEVVVAEVKPETVNAAPVVEPAPIDEKKQFSDRYAQVKGILNL